MKKFIIALLLLTACTDEYDHLCVDGHPRKRNPYVTYGGLAPMHGYQRDHRIPLCLGGPDTRANVRYELAEDALIKDIDERAACRDYCRRKITLDEARARFNKWSD